MAAPKTADVTAIDTAFNNQRDTGAEIGALYNELLPPLTRLAALAAKYGAGTVELIDAVRVAAAAARAAEPAPPPEPPRSIWEEQRPTRPRVGCRRSPGLA
jgi:hypothetical protein